MARFSLLIAMTIAALPALAQPSVAVEKECLKLAGHPDIRACLEQRAQESRLALQQAEASFRNALSHLDEEPNFKTRVGQWLSKSAVNFQRYQQSQCEFHASLAAGGNSAGDRRLLCIIELNDKRATELHEAETSLP